MLCAKHWPKVKSNVFLIEKNGGRFWGLDTKTESHKHFLNCNEVEHSSWWICGFVSFHCSSVAFCCWVRNPRGPGRGRWFFMYEPLGNISRPNVTHTYIHTYTHTHTHTHFSNSPRDVMWGLFLFQLFCFFLHLRTLGRTVVFTFKSVMPCRTSVKRKQNSGNRNLSQIYRINARATV